MSDVRWVLVCSAAVLGLLVLGPTGTVYRSGRSRVVRNRRREAIVLCGTEGNGGLIGFTSVLLGFLPPTRPNLYDFLHESSAAGPGETRGPGSQNRRLME